MRRSSNNSAALMDQPLESLIEMKAVFAARALREMILHSRDFLGTEFPVNIEMKTSSCLKTIHKTPSYAKLLQCIDDTARDSTNSNIIKGTFIPNVSAIYCKRGFPLESGSASIRPANGARAPTAARSGGTIREEA